MNKILSAFAVIFLLAGCASATPVKAVSYGLPANCNVKELVASDPAYKAFDKTAAGVDDSRDCAVGIPNSDVGIFFGYSVRTKAQWLVVTAKLVAEGYKKWNAGIGGVEVWRMESGDAETGQNCSLSGYVPGVSFSVTVPWSKCDDANDQKLVGYLVKHAQQ